MLQRAQVVGLAVALGLGGAVVAGLALVPSQVPVHVGPTWMSEMDEVDIYATILAHVAHQDPASSGKVQVAHTIRDSCQPSPQKMPSACGHTAVGRLTPGIEAALTEALARDHVDVTFGDQGDVWLHQVVTEASGTPAADIDRGHEHSKVHLKRIGGRWQIQAVTPEGT